MPFEIPFYHVFQIASKMQRGEDITNDDVARLVGSPGYQMMKMLDHNMTHEIFSRGIRYANRLPYRERAVYEATNQARFGRYSRRRGRRGSSRYPFGTRRYRRGSVQRGSIPGKRRFRRNHYNAYYA